jgi:lipopolysaccharide/colanic/teichoic acid biosynthesis glycosyltransferase
MSFNVIDSDKDLLNAHSKSSCCAMTPNPRPSREQSDGPGNGITERGVPDTKPPAAWHGGPRLVSDRSSHPQHSAQPRSATKRSRRRPFNEAAKRVFDFFGGLVLLVVALPIILIAAAAIRFESKGSPFFVQTRLGKNGRPFKIFKLRGMFIDARVRFPSYYDYSKKQDLDFCFHHEFDPRVTRAGNFIRKTSIDELPNFWNVVVGDLSLVGPRPEIPEVMALYGAYREEYLSVKPGVTCLSKCTGRDRLTKRETIEYDLDYIRRRGFKLDLQILWRTFRGVVSRRDVF